MFETEGFKDSLTQTVASETGAAGLRAYDGGIVVYLQQLASGNESVLMEREVRKTAGTRRGIPDALQSARELVIEGAKLAKAANRTTLTLDDVSAAYKVKFCSVWPFCK